MLFNLTKNITLTKIQDRTYTIVQIGVLTSALIGITAFIVGFLLPTISFSYNANISSLANTITRPIHQESRTIFSAVSDQNVDHASISIHIKNAEQLPEELTLILRKSYGAFLYPFTENSQSHENFESNLPFPDSSLISSSDSVFITSRDKKHAFNNESTFLASGYSYDKIIENTSSDDRAAYDEGKLFTMLSYHPDGTHFYDESLNTTYIVQDNALIAFSGATTEANVISVSKDSRDTALICTLEKSLFSSKKYTCSFDLHGISQFEGKRYQFASPEILPEEIESISISLSTQKSFENVMKRIIYVKSSIRDKYTQ